MMTPDQKWVMNQKILMSLIYVAYLLIFNTLQRNETPNLHY